MLLIEFSETATVRPLTVGSFERVSGVVMVGVTSGRQSSNVL